MKQRHRAKGWGWLSLWIVLMTALNPASAAEIDCDQYLKAPESYEPGKAQTMDLQKALDTEGFAHGGDDGKMGPQTRAALKLYCLDVTQVVTYQLGAQDLSEFQLINDIITNLQAIAPNADPAAITQGIDAALKDLPEKDNTVKKVKDFSPLVVPQTPVAAAGAPHRSDGNSTAYGVNPDLLDQLIQDSIREDLITLLQPLQNKQYASIALFDNAVVEHPEVEGQISDLYHDRAKAMIQQAAQKRHPLDELDTIQWKSAECGCVQDFKHVVYGFYPSWLVGDAAPAIDFSALSRIGYFALLMEPSGRLQEHSLWKKEQHRASFVKLAHRYRARADLVICHPDWPTWYRTVTDHQQTMIETVTGLVTTAPMCDGVTLYFKRYPENDTYSKALAAFLRKLNKVLKDSHPDIYLNLMLPAVTKENPPAAKKEYENTVRRFFTNLLSDQHTKATADALDLVRLILVFVEEPTTYAKKQMRYIIEKSFKGEQRKAVLRKIVPILNPPANFKDQSKNQQFEDDLIYFEDNFHGVGFWPLPTGEDKTVKEITEQINKAFLKPENQSFFQQLIYGRTQWFCSLICPNRVPIRWILAAGLVFLLGWGVGSFWICKLRVWYKKLFWYLLGLILIASALLIILMTCDPDLARRSTEIFIVLLLVLIGSAICRQINKMKKAKYP